MNKKKKSTNTSPYPDEAIDRLARAFYPAILACWNSEEGQREFAAWQAEQAHLSGKEKQSVPDGERPVIHIAIVCGFLQGASGRAHPVFSLLYIRCTKLRILMGETIPLYETVKAEMNGLTPGLDRSPPPRWMGGQGGQSLKVFGRTRSFWGLSSPKIEMGGKALKWLSRLDYPLAKTGETVNGGAESAVHLDR